MAHCKLCLLPSAAPGADIDHARLRLRGYVGAPDGKRHVSAEIEGAAADADTLGQALAAQLRQLGADSILSALDTP